MLIGKPTTGQLYVWLCAGLQINTATDINIATYVKRRVAAYNKDKEWMEWLTNTISYLIHNKTEQKYSVWLFSLSCGLARDMKALLIC